MHAHNSCFFDRIIQIYFNRLTHNGEMEHLIKLYRKVFVFSSNGNFSTQWYREQEMMLRCFSIRYFRSYLQHINRIIQSLCKSTGKISENQEKNYKTSNFSLSSMLLSKYALFVSMCNTEKYPLFTLEYFFCCQFTETFCYLINHYC